MTDHCKHDIQQYAFLEDFKCLGAECEDTCCIGWGMQINEGHKELYQKVAPELAESVTTLNPETPDLFIMKRDPETDYCVKFDNGLCGIHKQYGERFLGDACYFFPRSTRKFGDNTIVTATLSCPEIARLALLGENPFSLQHATTERLPETIKNYVPQGMEAEDALAVTKAFIDAAGDRSVSPEQALGRIIIASKSLDNIDIIRWKNGINIFLKTADTRFPETEYEVADPYRLLHALSGLIAAANATNKPKLMQIVSLMEQALDAKIDWETLEITTSDSQLTAGKNIRKTLNNNSEERISTILHQWIQAQLALASFPFAGLGNTPSERITIIAIRFATVKLALASYYAVNSSYPDDFGVITLIQGLSRFMDHLSDPTLSLNIYRDAGWTSDKKLFSLIGINNNKEKQHSTA